MTPVRRPSKKPRAPMFFKIILDPQADRLKIPIYFIKRYGLALPNPVFLRAPRGPSFQVELTINSDGETWLEKGWDKFKEYNSIDFGHFLVFKYDRHSNFRVLVFDKASTEIKYPSDANNHDETMTMSSDSGSESDDDIDSVEVDRTNAAYQRAKAFKSDNINQDHPCFIRLMQPSYVSSTSVLVIPTSIIRENFAEKVNNIKLRVCDGAMWCVTCSLQALNARIGVGWSSFVKDHNLKVGDACLFEVNKINKFVWNVFIFRH
ncbi:B3 domain-containing protein at3g18960 [Phtheirospermum japonicum]|uniref:B3 domain-containing protein at3g18960 n=1 Tax=Phtheirospermum japonicum TaxID=374723 RepID=A0A830DEQ8_9LAMI|nr:B3 domain-containing protein at3g18960 [Phtheirospermum japonicum]